MEIKLSQVLTKKFKGKTLGTLAKTIKIPKTLLYEWSIGRLPSGKNLIHLKKLADYFDCTLEELIFDSKQERQEEKKVLASTTFADEESKMEYRILIEKVSKKP